MTTIHYPLIVFPIACVVRVCELMTAGWRRLQRKGLLPLITGSISTCGNGSTTGFKTGLRSSVIADVDADGAAADGVAFATIADAFALESTDVNGISVVFLLLLELSQISTT